MAFPQPDWWTAQFKQESKSHTDWLCSYEHFLPIVKPLLKRPRAAALVIGSGASDFPEKLYDSGFKEVVVVDANTLAMEHVQLRNAEGGRLGLSCEAGDPSSSQAVQLKDLAKRFDLVVDKGTLDITLTYEDGWERATRALKWAYDLMRTPATMIYVSHSPPHDRMELLSTVYWHEIQFKMVKCTSIDQLISDQPYREHLVNYPYAVAGWEGAQLERLVGEVKEANAVIAAARRAAEKAERAQKAKGLPAAFGSETTISKNELLIEAPLPDVMPQRPTDDIGFASGLAYVYLLRK